MLTNKIEAILIKYGALNMDSIKHYLYMDYDIENAHFLGDDLIYIIKGMIIDDIIKKGSISGYYEIV